MKIVFNFKKVLVLALLMAPSLAGAQGVYWSTRDLLADFFRASASVGYQKVELTGDLRQRVEARLGYRVAKDSYVVFVATTGNRVDGYAIVDEENGEHLPITFAVKLSPAGVVERQEIVAYREARGDEVRDERFRRQFSGKASHDGLRVGEDVQVVSGATISSRAMAIGVKRALVLVDEAILGRRVIQLSSRR